MPVQVVMPEKKQGGDNSSMYRRLFAMGLGAMTGGAGAGAAGGASSGGMLGGLGGMIPGMGGGGEKPAPPVLPTGGSPQLQKLSKPELGDSAFSRRMDSLSLDPNITIQKGLDALPELGLPDDKRKEYTGALIQAQLMGGRNAGRRY